MPYKLPEHRNSRQRLAYEKSKTENHFQYRVYRARVRAKRLGVPFNLDASFLASLWTGNCPIFGTPLSQSSDRSDENAAELDRFIPEKGYVKGNVNFISRRANRLKNNVTTKELQQLIDWMKQYEN